MKKWWVLLCVCPLSIAVYTVSGPYRTIHAIREAVQAQDAAALSRQVDFPALRTSLKAQLSDRLVRKAGPELQSSIFAAFGLRVANGLIEPAVDAMVTPMGLGAIMEGRKEWAYASGGFTQPDTSAPPTDVLREVDSRFESPSRFTATLHDASGTDTIFVLTRSGLNWKLSDIRLPP